MKFAKFYQFCNGKFVQIAFEQLKPGMIFRKSGETKLHRCASNIICGYNDGNKSIKITRVRHV
jgi:hypothetical protein